MQKISPLRAGLEAFNRFKTNRLQAKSNTEASKSTNPFGISFKGAVMQMDVFETSSKKETVSNPFQSGLDKINKFTASARVAAMNKIEAVKQSAISFGSRLKENIVNTYNKMATTEVNFDLFRNSASRLQKRPVSELEDMFRKEISALEV